MTGYLRSTDTATTTVSLCTMSTIRGYARTRWDTCIPEYSLFYDLKIKIKPKEIGILEGVDGICSGRKMGKAYTSGEDDPGRRNMGAAPTEREKIRVGMKLGIVTAGEEDGDCSCPRARRFSGGAVAAAVILSPVLQLGRLEAEHAARAAGGWS